MKNSIKLTGLVICLFVTASINAQRTINASDIMKDVKSGKNITYNNVTIVGDLDFTFMDEKLDKLPKRKRFWNNNSSNKIEELVTGKVSFKNCTFQDNVFAYIHHEDSGYTFVANFDDTVVFKNCTFKEESQFKYSNFRTNADFSDSKFNGDSSFKYAKFKRDISFTNTVFGEESTFKYAEFSNHVSFANAVFKESATFKYSKFKDGVSFRKVRFEEDLNIKYTKVSGKFDISGMHVAYDIDSKYTKINGSSFSKHLINKN